MHCGEVEPVEGLEQQAVFLADYWFSEHGGKGQIQPELPGIEKVPNLVVVHSL
jgi:hypothetical protein